MSLSLNGDVPPTNLGMGGVETIASRFKLVVGSTDHGVEGVLNCLLVASADTRETEPFCKRHATSDSTPLDGDLLSLRFT